MKKQNTVMTHYHSYPQADIHCYKRHLDDDPETQARPRAQVLEVKNAVARRQREMVRELDQRRKALEKQTLQARLREEIAEKRRQIQELEVQRQRAEQQQLKSFELARIRQEQIDREQVQKDRRRVQLGILTKQRGGEAQRRAIEQREQAQAKEREAQRRRDVAVEAQRKSRKMAIKYREFQETQEQVKEAKPTFDQFNKNHGTAKYNRNIDYSKTFLHNPVVVKAREVEIDAHQKARILQEEIESRRQRKRAVEEQQEVRFHQRSVEAFGKLGAQKMAQELKKEASLELLRYNKEKIEMGKKDQGVGVRPLTKAQKELSKQLRDQEEFEQVFFAGKNPEWVSQPVERHEIEDNRQCLRRHQQQKVVAKERVQSRKISQSRIPQASTVKYSFEDEALSIGSQYSLSPNGHYFQYKSHDQLGKSEDMGSGSASSIQQSPGTGYAGSPLAETRKPPKENSTKAVIVQRPKILRNSNGSDQKAERRIVFNNQTDYSRGSDAKVSPIKRSQESSKLNNMCQHRQQSDLSYSQDSLEEDL